MDNNISQEMIQEEINDRATDKTSFYEINEIDPSFFMTKEQKQRNEKNEKLKDVKPVYYSITKATKLYG